MYLTPLAWRAPLDWRSMVTVESVALELLEYKIDALVARRHVRGGVTSMWALHDAIDRGLTALDPEERTRFAEAARRLRAVADIPTRGTGTVTVDLHTLSLDEEDEEGLLAVEDPPPTPEAAPDVRAEQAVLQRLAERVYLEELDDVVVRLAAGWRAERDRLTPRLVFAAIRNLRRYAEEPGFASDVNLKNFKVRDPLPEREDPLISLSDLDSLSEVARELVDLILSLGQGRGPFPQLEVPEANALGYVRQALTRVAQDPYAGRFSPIVRRAPSSKELRTALQELAKERLPEGQRAALRTDLEARLTEALAFERHQRQVFQRDVQQTLAAATALMDRLERHLPARVGGRAPGPRLAGGVLFAVNPALRWEKVPHGANAVTLRVLGPVRFTIGGHEVAVMGSGSSRTLFVDEAPHPLEPHLDLKVDGGRLLVDVEDDYIHLRFRDEARSLATRLAQGLAVFHVLSHERADDLLAVLSGLADVPSGSPDDLVLRAVARAGEISSRAPNRRDAIEGLVRGAARAANRDLEDNVVLGLVERILTALTVTAADLAGLMEREQDSEGGVYHLTGDPITPEVGRLKLTVRHYRGRGRGAPDQMVVMLPGHVIGSFQDLLVEGVAGGTLICARGDQELAVLYLRDRPVAIAA
jgi:hypothetical protein